jgi:hypothetical protein
MIGVETIEPEVRWVGMVSPGVSVPMDSIRTSGAYVCNWNGHLLRVPEQALVPDGVINIIGPEPLFVTKISDDPDLPLGRARQTAASLNLLTSF